MSRHERYEDGELVEVEEVEDAVPADGIIEGTEDRLDALEARVDAAAALAEDANATAQEVAEAMRERRP